MAKWFRDYVYRPMGGDRQGELRTAFNGMFTWLLFGLWHGPAWTFVAWGAYGGALLVPYRFLKGRGWLPKSSWPTRLLARALFVANLNIASVIFRADTIPDAIEYYHRMFVLTRDGEALSPLWGVLIAGLAAWHAANKRFFPDGFSLRWPTALTALWFGAMAAALTLLAGSPAPFYYFQF